jgi:hypothetical protein
MTAGRNEVTMARRPADTTVLARVSANEAGAYVMSPQQVEVIALPESSFRSFGSTPNMQAQSDDANDST